MQYIFRGKLRGIICPDCIENLSGVTVRLYRPPKPDEALVLATANPKGTFRLLEQADTDGKADLLIAEVRTDDDGNFVFKLGKEQSYQGKAFEIDAYFETVPGQKEQKQTPPPRQITITTLQPQWMQKEDALEAIWDYTIPQRFWCLLRSKFNAWVICGHVFDCQQKPPFPIQGVKVIAFDRDWLQDDELGFGITDATGKFRIDYTIADFQKTPFSPWINMEFIPGPDLYFRVETFDGTPLLEELPSRGRDGDRENAGPCFCVKLCAEKPLAEPGDYPYFTRVGDFNIATDIDATTGLTNKAKSGHGGPDFGFFGKLRLKGFCPKKWPGDTQPLHYRFLCVHPDDPATEVPVVGNLVPGTTPSGGIIVGARVLNWDLLGTGLMPTFQDVIILRSGAASLPDSLPTPPAVPPGTPWGPPSPHILVPDANGWIRVDQSPNLLDDGFQGNLTGFLSANFVPGGPIAGPDAGQNPAGVARDGKKIRIIFEIATDPTNPATVQRQILEANILVNNWLEIAQLNIQQFIGPVTGSCTGLSDDLNILYTADHERMHSWSITIDTAASVVIPALPSGTGPRGGFGNHYVPIGTWPSCSYLVRLHFKRALTNGIVDDDQDNIPVTFCK